VGLKASAPARWGVSGTPFARFAELGRRLRETDGRDAKVDLAAGFLAELAPDERAPGARFLAGELLAPVNPRSVDVGPSTIEGAASGSQAALTPGPLTVRGLAAAVDELAGLAGAGSDDRRRAIVAGLLGRLDENDRPWLEQLFLGELRTGVREGLVLEAIASAAEVDGPRVRRAHMLRGDVGEVAHLAVDGGAEALDEVGLEVGRPVRPMLAGRADDVQDALVQLGGPAAFETKLDGARVQLHREGDTVRVFSRRLTDVTESLPEAVEVARGLEAERAIVEGEVVAVDERGRPRPFQELMRRFRREHGRAQAAAEVPVQVHLFDCLAHGADALLDEPLAERVARLREIAGEELLVDRTVTGDPGSAREQLQVALGLGHEGIVAKALDSTYTPGRRGERWLKLKPSETLDLVVLGAEWGHGRREGWLSNLHLGVRVPDEGPAPVEPDEAPSGPVRRRDGFAMVGKTFKGLTDDQLATLTDRLDDLAVERPDWGVVARPSLVVEVAFDEVQDSPHYDSGFALRFARVKAIREDLAPEDAATLADVRERRPGGGPGRSAEGEI